MYSRNEEVSIRRWKGFYVNYTCRFKRVLTKTVGFVYYFYNTYIFFILWCALSLYVLVVFSSISHIVVPCHNSENYRCNVLSSLLRTLYNQYIYTKPVVIFVSYELAYMMNIFS